MDVLLQCRFIMFHQNVSGFNEWTLPLLCIADLNAEIRFLDINFSVLSVMKHLRPVPLCPALCNASFLCPLIELTAVELFPPTLFKCFGKIYSTLTVFFSPFLTPYCCWRTCSSSLHLASDSSSPHSQPRQEVIFSVPLSISAPPQHTHSLSLFVFGWSHFLIFVSIYFYLPVPTCCSGIYP